MMCIQLDYYTNDCTIQNRLDVSDNIAVSELEYMIKQGYKCYKNVRGRLRRTWVDLNKIDCIKRIEIHESWIDLIMLDGRKIIMR